MTDRYVIVVSEDRGPVAGSGQQCADCGLLVANILQASVKIFIFHRPSRRATCRRLDERDAGWV